MHEDGHQPKSTFTRWRQLLLVTIPFVVLVTSPWWFRILLFDDTKPAYDRNWEYRNGKTVAWGPRPRLAQLRILGLPPESTFFGNEWYFRLYRGYCTRWVLAHGFELPPPEAW